MDLRSVIRAVDEQRNAYRSQEHGTEKGDRFPGGDITYLAVRHVRASPLDPTVIFKSRKHATPRTSSLPAEELATSLTLAPDSRSHSYPHSRARTLFRGLNAEVAPPRVNLHGQLAPCVVHA